MTKNVVILVLLALLICTNIIWRYFYNSDIEHADSVAELEIRSKEKSIESMSDIIVHIYKDKDKHDLVETLKVEFNTEEVWIDGDWVYFRNIKFQFVDSKLIRVF